MSKTVLCFGDSNTWGAAPEGYRYDVATRWPRAMARILGDGYDVIEEGFGGRTCLIDDPVEGGFKSGANYLPPCLMSHSPLDLVIIMLGTNDTKRRFGLNPFTIAQGAGELVKIALRYGLDAREQSAKILLASPILVGENLMGCVPMAHIFGQEAIETAKGLAAEYRKIAHQHKAEYLDASQFADPSPLDAIHMSAEAHLNLARAMADKVIAILG